MLTSPATLRSQSISSTPTRFTSTPLTHRSVRRWWIICPRRRPSLLLEKVLGDISGAPNILPYAEDVYKYFRLLEASSPRVKVMTIGHSEEGREMIAVAVADPELLAGAKANDARLAKLSDPRSINLDDANRPSACRSVVPRLLHHRNHPLDGDRRAHRADGAGLSSCGGQRALHQIHSLAHDSC